MWSNPVGGEKRAGGRESSAKYPVAVFLRGPRRETSTPRDAVERMCEYRGRPLVVKPRKSRARRRMRARGGMRALAYLYLPGPPGSAACASERAGARARADPLASSRGCGPFYSASPPPAAAGSLQSPLCCSATPLRRFGTLPRTRASHYAAHFIRRCDVTHHTLGRVMHV